VRLLVQHSLEGQRTFTVIAGDSFGAIGRSKIAEPAIARTGAFRWLSTAHKIQVVSNSLAEVFVDGRRRYVYVQSSIVISLYRMDPENVLPANALEKGSSAM
jgi:hypothetical protein